LVIIVAIFGDLLLWAPLFWVVTTVVMVRYLPADPMSIVRWLLFTGLVAAPLVLLRWVFRSYHRPALSEQPAGRRPGWLVTMAGLLACCLTVAGLIWVHRLDMHTTVTGGDSLDFAKVVPHVLEAAQPWYGKGAVSEVIVHAERHDGHLRPFRARFRFLHHPDWATADPAPMYYHDEYLWATWDASGRMRLSRRVERFWENPFEYLVMLPVDGISDYFKENDSHGLMVGPLDAEELAYSAGTMLADAVRQGKIGDEGRFPLVAFQVTSGQFGVVRQMTLGDRATKESLTIQFSDERTLTREEGQDDYPWDAIDDTVMIF
jgi:hypothetical protein